MDKGRNSNNGYRLPKFGPTTEITHLRFPLSYNCGSLLSYLRIFTLSFDEVRLNGQWTVLGGLVAKKFTCANPIREFRRQKLFTWNFKISFKTMSFSVFFELIFRSEGSKIQIRRSIYNALRGSREFVRSGYYGWFVPVLHSKAGFCNN